MKSHYELLGVPPEASTEEIKHAFRREISRYHPDKVQHLGQEFQDLAVGRAAELTRAYRVLIDENTRAAYDDELRKIKAPASPPFSPVPSSQAAPDAAGAPPPPAPEPEPPRAAPRDRTGEQVVRRAALMRFREALDATFEALESTPARGFDIAGTHRPKRGLFRKSAPDLRMLVRFVPFVDAGAVNETWPLAVRALPDAEARACVFLMGVGLADRAELAQAIDANRRQARGRARGLSLVPTDVRDWGALIPTGAPSEVRTILERLRKPE